jgi:hypothetical protein
MNTMLRNTVCRSSRTCKRWAGKCRRHDSGLRDAVNPIHQQQWNIIIIAAHTNFLFESSIMRFFTCLDHLSYKIRASFSHRLIMCLHFPDRHWQTIRHRSNLRRAPTRSRSPPRNSRKCRANCRRSAAAFRRSVAPPRRRRYCTPRVHLCHTGADW